jgi:hypothetical protein
VITADVTGANVRLSWPPGGYSDIGSRLEIGSRPGLSDLGVVPVGNSLAGAAAPGVYFVRFRRVSLAGLGEPSLDTQVVVGNVPAPPERPGEIRAAVLGHTVSMSWASSAGASAVSHYVIEAGLAARATALRLPTSDAQPRYVVHDVPAGVYYVRVRAVNAAGEGVASRDTRIVVP